MRGRGGGDLDHAALGVGQAQGAGMQVQLRKVAKGWIQTGKTGEGFVMDINGPGRVWTQSRNPGALVDWLTQVLPFTRS